MENRERDRVSQRTTPTDAGELNRSVEEEKGRQHHSGTTAEFGQNIGESEFPSEEGGNLNMRNRNEDMKNSNMGNESSRRSGSGSMGSSSGRSSGSSNEMGSNSNSGSTTNRRGSTGELGSTGSSEGRH
jgi:hypothetical protein